MYTTENKIKLIDFDAIRTYNITQNKDTLNLGTIGYAAPEQYGFAQMDFRTDIYAFGITLKALSKRNLYKKLFKSALILTLKSDIKTL